MKSTKLEPFSYASPESWSPLLWKIVKADYCFKLLSFGVAHYVVISKQILSWRGVPQWKTYTKKIGKEGSTQKSVEAGRTLKCQGRFEELDGKNLMAFSETATGETIINFLQMTLHTSETWIKRLQDAIQPSRISCSFLVPSNKFQWT